MEFMNSIIGLITSFIFMAGSAIGIILLIQRWQRNSTNLKYQNIKFELESIKIEGEKEELSNLNNKNIIDKVLDYLKRRAIQIKSEFKMCRSQKLCSLHKDRVILKAEFNEVVTLVNGLKKGKSGA